LAAERAADLVGGEGDADQVLAKPVVEVVADAALLVGAGLDDLPLEVPAVGEVVNDAGEYPSFAGVDLADREADGEGRAVIARGGDLTTDADDFGRTGFEILL